MIRGRVKSSSIIKLILFKTHHSQFTFCHKFFYSQSMIVFCLSLDNINIPFNLNVV